jgi:hypothetical protein
MKSSVTARYALRHGLPKNAQTTNPYAHIRGGAKWVVLTDVRSSGTSHVELRTESGGWFRVDATHPIFSVKP